MAPVEVICSAVLALWAVISGVFGSGLFKQMIRHSNEMAVQKHEMEQTKIKVNKNDESINALNTLVALQDKDIKGFQSHILKLEMIPEINAKLSTIDATMNYLKEQIRDFRSERQEHDRNN